MEIAYFTDWPYRWVPEDEVLKNKAFFNEVVPALREYAKEIDLLDSFQRTPGLVALQPGAARIPVSDRGPMEELSLK